jgi:hypothetical protein
MARRAAKAAAPRKAAKRAVGAVKKAATSRKPAIGSARPALPSAGAPAPREPAWRAGLLAEMSRGLQRVDATLGRAEPAPKSRGAGKKAQAELRASVRSAAERLAALVKRTKEA